MSVQAITFELLLLGILSSVYRYILAISRSSFEYQDHWVKVKVKCILSCILPKLSILCVSIPLIHD